MRNHRFNKTTSSIILGILVIIACGILWFAMQAYVEIAEITPSLGAQAVFDDNLDVTFERAAKKRE